MEKHKSTSNPEREDELDLKQYRWKRINKT